MRTATGRTAAIATAFPAASDAGIEMLRAGGTAVDAALAAAWALAVCEPSGSGLGGQTVLLLRLTGGEVIVLDGHSHAPRTVSRRAVSRQDQRRGHRATTVPTTPAVLAHAQSRFGTLPLARVMEPAIRLADDGYAITPLQRRQLQWCRSALRATAPAARFLGERGRTRKVGERFRQPRLADALRRIARDGADDFYRGAIARAIAEDMRRHGGLLDLDDLEALAPPAERAPLVVAHGEGTVLTAPPPGGGAELALALQLLERLPCDETPADHYVRIAQATHAAFAERELRAERRADAAPAGSARLREVTAGVIERRLEPVAATAEGPGETTHLCAADAEGNAVSLTQSIQSLFGAKVANDRYGFLYNNYLTTCPRRRHRHRLRGGAPARSNAVPTLVLDGDRRPVLALGAAGSRRIISSTLQVLHAALDRGVALDDALALPRVHPRMSRRTWLEADAGGREVADALQRAGFPVVPRPAQSFAMGAVHALAWHPDGTMTAAADPRREGSARAL